MSYDRMLRLEVCEPYHPFDPFGEIKPMFAVLEFDLLEGLVTLPSGFKTTIVDLVRAINVAMVAQSRYLEDRRRATR